MSTIARNYELPATGAEKTQNTCIAAALAAIGVGGRTQITSHRGVRGSTEDREFFTYHFAPRGTLFPDVKTSDLVGRLITRTIDSAGPWDEPTLLFLAAWMALESRREFYRAAARFYAGDLQMARTGPGLCSLEAPRQGNVTDLRKVARDANLPARRVQGKRACFALIALGFVPLDFSEEGFLMTEESVTFKGLTLELCRVAYGDIDTYNRRLSRGGVGVIPSPPEISLPDFRPGFHPFQFAVQGLFNYTQLLEAIKARTTPTLFLKNGHAGDRTAIVDENAPEQVIEQAVAHVRRK